ncbi:MAG: L,D-transpeptidase family protein [Candidatus Uhrbacteria bacterium]|nr:L,D-transpeptidase family protein [Candidatus Uhrbacteria bacterium]
MRENRLFLALLCLVTAIALGCLSYGTDAQSKDKLTLDPTNLAVVTVEISEPEIKVPTQTNGCVETIKELELPYHVKADDERLLTDRLIVVRKGERRLLLFSDGQLRHDRPGDSPDCWRIGLGYQPVFDKIAEGDGRTPEGLFRTGDKPWSQYHGAILVHYPSPRHAQYAYNAGRVTKGVVDAITRADLTATAPPQTTPLGGNILIHGGGSASDWTLGCIALQSQDLEELRSFLPKSKKTWILILP